jgi:glutaconyl-CoA/methylmalonyl-CoA decarboxylase subunit gamma
MRMFRVRVNGNDYEVGIEEIGGKTATLEPNHSAVQTTAPKPAPQQSTPKAARPQAKESTDDNTIAAAIPGTILEVKVRQGDRVKRGDTLLILEAMKMENEIMAPHDGTVASIHVEKGNAVNVGTLLVILA